MRDGNISTAPAPGESLRRVIGFLRPHAGGMAAAAAMFIVSASNLIAPQFIRHAIDSGMPTGFWSWTEGVSSRVAHTKRWPEAQARTRS